MLWLDLLGPCAKPGALEVSNQFLQLIDTILLAQVAALPDSKQRFQVLDIIRKISRFGSWEMTIISSSLVLPQKIARFTLPQL